MRTAPLLLAGLGLCSGALATPPKPLPTGDGALSQWGDGGRDGSIVLYSNITYRDPNEYYLPQTSAEAPFGDDLHMVSGGLLDRFTFAYYDPPGGSALSQVEVLFYRDDPNEPGDYPGGEPASPLLGSYTVSELPGDGHWLVTADVGADPLPLPKDVWMELDFADNPEAGLAFYHPWTVGTSYDWFEIHGRGIFWFGSEPRSGFGLGVTPDWIRSSSCR